MSETFEKNGVTTTTQRRSTYILGSRSKFNTPEELAEWKKTVEPEANKRHVFVVKKRDTKLHKDIFICDVVGRFYAVSGCDIYSIVFKHSFEIDFLYTHTT
ncbi:MAG: hypothetical protein Q8O12_04675 [Candidatus Omnitrophota bacterium]|nr:hypothetical protein [Candidatus Omnitrophota bacterium]